MKLVPTLSWTIPTEPPEALDERLLPLLAAIARTGSLAHAVAHCAMSYRAGWGLLRDYRRALGVELVRLERGRGASLASAGEQLVEATAAAARRLARIAPALAIEVGADLRPTGHAPPARLRIAASHDLALAALRDALPAAAALELELSFMGSLLALQTFAQGNADMAGFHVPMGVRAAKERAPFLRWLSARRDRLIRFVDREQGLILPHGNPGRVKSFRDIAARELRFVNRQRGSGTRLLIERRVADEGLEPEVLAGYANEEFTHAAVAATVASGGADAGFGLRAAAAEYGLAFVPLVRERYFLAVRAAEVERPAVARLIDSLRSPLFARLAARLPGYQVAAAGALVGVETLARAGRDRS